ncbi:MAG: hypothetical protein H6733_01420 [Alphaproteobacteria bacterium]|nr:hypothetical protein [Alphaproteobacteria bacterium]
MTAHALPGPSHDLAHDGRDLALQLHGLLKELDPARWRPELEGSLREALTTVRAGMERLLGALDGHPSFAALSDALTRAHAILTESLPAAGLTPRQARRAWKAFRTQLLAAYTDLSRSLEAWDVHVPSLRPTNYARNVFHVAWAGVAIAVLWLWPVRSIVLPVIGGFLLAGWTMEISRRRFPAVNDAIMVVLGKVAHPHEWHRVNSATWYTTALFVLAWLDVLTAGLVAVTVLGFGDPAAAIIGRRYGRTQLVNGRSLEGSLAFLVTATLTSSVVLVAARPALPVLPAVLAALVASACGAVAELVSRRVDDNLSVPLSAAAGATFVFSLFGLGA